MISFKKVEPRIIELDFSGEITGEDYKEVKPKIESAMNEEGKLKFLMDLSQAKSFTAGSMYEDIKFDLQHFKNIGSTAVIASKKTYEMMTKALNLVYPEKVYHFEDQATALSWLKAQAV